MEKAVFVYRGTELFDKCVHGHTVVDHVTERSNDGRYPMF